MKSFAVFLLLMFLVARGGTVQFSSWPNGVEFWDDGAEKSKRSESSESSYSSSASSSSSSDSSGAFHVKVEEYEHKTDNSGTHEVRKTFEKKKPAGENETYSSKTVEIIRFPNGTIQRKVKNSGSGMKAECTTSKDCGADKFCNQLFYQCQHCIDDFGCFSNDQCCGDKVCKFGKCITEPVHTGLVQSPCDDDSQCKTGLYCLYNIFERGKCVEPRKEGESCNKGIFFTEHPKCAKGLQCTRTMGFGFFVNYKCLKPGSVEDKSAYDSPFDWFNWRI